MSGGRPHGIEAEGPSEASSTTQRSLLRGERPPADPTTDAPNMAWHALGPRRSGVHTARTDGPGPVGRGGGGSGGEDSGNGEGDGGGGEGGGGEGGGGEGGGGEGGGDGANGGGGAISWQTM